MLDVLPRIPDSVWLLLDLLLKLVQIAALVVASHVVLIVINFQLVPIEVAVISFRVDRAQGLGPFRAQTVVHDVIADFQAHLRTRLNQFRRRNRVLFLQANTFVSCLGTERCCDVALFP